MIKIDIIQLIQEYKDSRGAPHRASLSISATEENRAGEDQVVVLLEQFLVRNPWISDDYDIDYETFLIFLDTQGVDASTLFTPAYFARFGSSRIFISWVSNTRINWENWAPVLSRLGYVFKTLLERSLLTLRDSVRFLGVDSSLQVTDIPLMLASFSVLSDLNMLDTEMLDKMAHYGLSAWASAILSLQRRGLGHLLRESCSTPYLDAVESLDKLGVLNESYANAILRRPVAAGSEYYRSANRVIGLARYHNDINDVTIRKPDGTELRVTEAVLNILVNDLPGHEDIVTAIGILKCYNLLSAEHFKTLLTSSYLEYTTRVLSKMKEFDLLLPTDVEEILGHQQYMPALSRKLEAFMLSGTIRPVYIKGSCENIWYLGRYVKAELRHMLENLSSAFEGEVSTQADEARSAALFSVPAAAGAASVAAGAASASASPM
jgi:hypothetical protein